MKEAIVFAFSIGISTQDFWKLTPYLLKCCAQGHCRKIEELHDMMAWNMWHGAGLTKSPDKLPPLERFMSGRKNKVKGIDEAAIMQGLKSYQAQIDGNSSKNNRRPTGK